MRAWILEKPGQDLVSRELPTPVPGPGQVLVEVRACGVCRTDLHVRDGELSKPKLPLVLGHQIAGTLARLGAGVSGLEIGQRVGVPWLGRACGSCGYCRAGRENLCDDAAFTGYELDGGYAEYALADARFVLPLPDAYGDTAVAPLLCAGLIGYRALSMTGDAQTLGLYGFGASAHIVLQVAKFQGRRVFAFTRPGDVAAQRFARELGADWAGSSGEAPPEALEAAIVFAPVGALIPEALGSLRKGGTVVCAGIHMSEIPSFRYELLWGERSIRSVANLTRRDGTEFLELAPKVPVRTEVALYPLADANRALDDLATGRVRGAAVLDIRGGLDARGG